MPFHTQEVRFGRVLIPSATFKILLIKLVINMIIVLKVISGVAGNNLCKSSKKLIDEQIFRRKVWKIETKCLLLQAKT